VTRKAEKDTDAVPGAGTKRHLDEWMSFVVQKESLRNKLMWPQVHANMLDTDRHRTSRWAQLHPLQLQWRHRREVFARASATPSHSYGVLLRVSAIISYYLELNIHSVCHAELLEFLARHGRLHTYKLLRLSPNIWLYGVPLETFSWLPW